MELLERLCSLITLGLDELLETAVPLIAVVAEVVGLIIIVLSLVKAAYHYFRVTFFHDTFDFHHEISSGLTTALEFLMSAEVAKTFLVPTVESVLPLAATFGLRALMSLLIHLEMHTARAERADARHERFISALHAESVSSEPEEKKDGAGQE